MYLVSISKLKRELARDELTGSFPYFIAYFTLDAVLISIWGMYAVEGSPTALDGIEAALYFVVVVGGTVASYYSNGGRSGMVFLDRYFALTWVLGIRFLLALLPIMVIFEYYVWTDDEYPEETVWTDVAIYVLTMVAYYWRLNLHIRDVYRAGSNQQFQRIGEDAGR